MVFGVKNTTMTQFFELLAPHYCMICGEIGQVLCGNCKNDNISDGLNYCLKCGVVVNRECEQCKMPFERSWMVGWRSEAIGTLVERYKYESVRALAWPLAEMMDATLPCLPDDTVVVPVPTIAKHVRQRGLDHTRLFAGKLAKMRGWRCEMLVERRTDTVQVGAKRADRLRQAKEAFKIKGEIKKDAYYLVVDDVWTTGATICAICELLKKAGAENIMVAVLAKSR